MGYKIMEHPDIDNLKEWILDIHEKYYIELKKAQELPASFWESYSAFSNTNGGWIILGVEEHHPQNIIKGVGNVEKTLVNLWNQLSNPNKVSFRTVENSDVSVHIIDDSQVIIVRIKEAPETMKPVYLNGRTQDTYIRTGDGDRKATEEELRSFLRNAQPNQDTLAAESFTIKDLDPASIAIYKSKVSKRYPSKGYLDMSDQDFLLEIGASHIDRNTGEYKIKKGALLFLGKYNSIKELFPQYHLDYFNRRGNNPRWSDRVSDDEPNDSEMNIFNFYSIVHEKLRALLQDSFGLDEGQIRISPSEFDETLRECLVNCLAHADYIKGYPSTKIEVYDGWFCFSNPGKMLVSPEQFVVGGDSRPRNEIVMKLFRLLGASERQGFGGPLIYKTASKSEYRWPEITTNLEKTELKVWNVDLAESYPYLNDNEKAVFRMFAKSGKPQSINEVREKMGYTEYQMRKIVGQLHSYELLRKIGNGPATKYDVGLSTQEVLVKLQMLIDKLKHEV